MLTAVMRFPARLEEAGLSPEDMLPLPEDLHETGWKDLLSGVEHAPAGALRAGDLFWAAPVAVLVPR